MSSFCDVHKASGLIYQTKEVCTLQKVKSGVEYNLSDLLRSAIFGLVMVLCSL